MISKIKLFRKVYSNFKELKKILKQIKNSIKSDKILIIGSSGLIKNYYLEKIINNFPFVIRLNANPTKGFEKYVGTKMDLHACHELIFNCNLSKYNTIQNIDDNYINNIKNSKIFVIKETELKNISKVKNRNNEIIVFPAYLNKYLRFITISKFNYYKKFKSLKENKFSIGLVLICIFLILKKKIYIAGFDLNKTSNNINYYYQTTLNLEKITVHNFSKENDIIKKLIINKKVINLME
jgi:hypothetical protein